MNDLLLGFDSINRDVVSEFVFHFTANLQTAAHLLCCCSPFWNFSMVSNVILYERCCSHFLPPNAEVELMRAQLVSKLRQNYQELCRTRECEYCSNTFI